jgi:hypothetical protein
MSFVSLDRLVKGGHVAEADAGRVEELWAEIKRLKRDKRAYIPAHNYQVPEVQAIADTVGDSFELAVRARDVDANLVLHQGQRRQARIAGHEQAVDSGSPIGACHERRDDVRREEGRHEQEDVLHPMERPQQDKSRDSESSRGNGRVAAHSREIEARGHTGELRTGRADVRDEKGKNSECREANSVPLADETRQPLSCDDTHACAELVKEDERKRREAENPQELVAVVGPEDRIRGDAGCVVV